MNVPAHRARTQRAPREIRAINHIFFSSKDLHMAPV
jgi:hypothetical protein